MPIHSLTQAITGSVALSEQAGVLLNSGSVTGLLVGGQPLSSGNPLPIAGSITSQNNSVGATGSLAPLSASLIGGVNGGGNLQPVNILSGALIITGSVQISNFPASQAITGSVIVANQVNITGSSWTPTITGSVVVSNQVNVTGSVGITGPVAVSNFPAVQVVSASNWIPTITGSVVVSNIVGVTGTVGIAAPVAVLQGTTPWVVSGSGVFAVTGSLQVSNRVDVRALATSGTVVFVSGAVNGNVTVAAANLARAGITLYNDTNKIAYVKLGVSASLIDYTTQLAKDEYYEIPYGYTGRIDVFTPAATTGVIRITELF